MKRLEEIAICCYLVIFAVIGCNSSTTISTYSPENRIMPLAVGNYWIFDSWNPYNDYHWVDTMRCDTIKLLDGKHWYRMRGTVYGYYREDETGVYFRRYSDKNEEQLFLPKPLVMGEGWIRVARQEYNEGEGYMETDTIAGTYVGNRDAHMLNDDVYNDCIYVDIDYISYHDDREINVVNDDVEYWKPGIGRIKYNNGLNHELIAFRVH